MTKILTTRLSRTENNSKLAKGSFLADRFIVYTVILISLLVGMLWLGESFGRFPIFSRIRRLVSAVSFQIRGPKYVIQILHELHVKTCNKRLNTDGKKVLIVSRYMEDISWIPNLFDGSWTIQICDKNNSNGNIGRESESFARGILEIYEELSETDLVVLLQGYPWGHIQEWRLPMEIQNSLQCENDIVPLGQKLYSDDRGGPSDPGLFVKEAWELLFGETNKTYWIAAAGGQYALHGRVIMRKSKKFWEVLHSLTLTNKKFENPHTTGKIDPWVMERLWMSLFMESDPATI